MKAEPETGIINDQMDADGFSRRYALFSELSHQPGRAYLTLGLKAVSLFLVFLIQQCLDLIQIIISGIMED